MRPSDDLAEVYVCTVPVDFRKQINGLAAVVEAELGLDPFASRLYVFTNTRRNRCKILYFERSGFVLWQKRLERERFHWPKAEESTVVLTGQQLNWLLDGFDLALWRPHEALEFESIF